MIFLLASRFLGVIREALIAAIFGQGVVTDLYQYGFAITDVLYFLIAGGALSASFIPIFTELLKTDRESEAWELFSAVTTLMTVATLILISVAWVLTPAFVHWYCPLAKDPALIVTMSRIVLPAQFAFLIGGLLFGSLYARGVFSVPGLGPNIYNLGLIFGAAVLSQFIQPGILGVCWGAVIGAFVGNLIIPGFVMARQGAQFRISFDTKSEHVRKVFKLMLPVILGLSLPAVYMFILRYATGIYNIDGLTTAASNANTIMQAPLGIFGQGMAIAAFPALSQFFALGQMDKYRAQLVGTLRTVLYLCLPVSIYLIAAAPQVIQALYEHRKFTHADTLRTAPILAAFSFGIFAWCLHPVLMRGFFSIQQTKRPIIITTLTVFLFCGLCQVVAMLNLPFIYMPLAGSVSALVMVIALFVSLQRQIGAIDIKGIISTGLRSLVACLVPAGVVFSLYQLLSPYQILNNPIVDKLGVFFTFCLFGWIYYAITRKFGMTESEYVTRAMSRFDRRGQTPS